MLRGGASRRWVGRWKGGGERTGARSRARSRAMTTTGAASSRPAGLAASHAPELQRARAQDARLLVLGHVPRGNALGGVHRLALGAAAGAALLGGRRVEHLYGLPRRLLLQNPKRRQGRRPRALARQTLRMAVRQRRSVSRAHAPERRLPPAPRAPRPSPVAVKRNAPPAAAPPRRPRRQRARRRPPRSPRRHRRCRRPGPWLLLQGAARSRVATARNGSRWSRACGGSWFHLCALVAKRRARKYGDRRYVGAQSARGCAVRATFRIFVGSRAPSSGIQCAIVLNAHSSYSAHALHCVALYCMRRFLPRAWARLKLCALLTRRRQ
jgi:hypothetical protein